MTRGGAAIVVIALALAGLACGDRVSRPRAYVPVRLQHFSGLRYQPQRLIPAGDGSEILTEIRYQEYGRAQALATGTLLVDDCVESCGAGTFHPVEAKLVFDKLAMCRGRRVYTTLEIEAAGARRFNYTGHQTVRLDYMAARCEPGQR